MTDLAVSAPDADTGSSESSNDNSSKYAEDGSLIESETPAAPAKKEKPLIDQVKTGEAEKKEPPAPPPAPRKKFKVKNREVELTEEEQYQHAQRSLGGDLRWEEANEIKRKAQEVLDREQRARDPKTRMQALRELVGEDFNAVAEETTYEKFNREQQLAQMTDRERAFHRQLEEKDRMLQEFHAKEQQQTKARQEARERAVYEGIASQINSTAQEAINGMKLDPKFRPQMADRVLNRVQTMVENGIQLTPQALSSFAMEDIRGEHAALRDNMEPQALADWMKPDIDRLGEAMSDEQAYNWMGEKFANKVMRFCIKRHREGGRPQQQVQQQAATPTNGHTNGAPKSFRPAWDEVNADIEKYT